MLSGIAATILMLGGIAFLGLACLGVLRLPDAFLRMHAATKAGVAGAGLALLAAAAAIGTGEAWVKALLAFAFLLATAPIASHLLGRAAYISGAPLWRGTAADALRGVLGDPQDRPGGPAFAFAGAPGGAAPPAAAPRVQAPAPAAAPGARAADRAEQSLRRVLVAFLPGGDRDRALDAAAALARRHGCALTGLTHVDAQALSRVGAVPIGAGHHAQRLREHRSAAARDEAGRHLAAFEARARELGVDWSARHEEGRLDRALSELCAEHDVLVASEPLAADGPKPPAPRLPALPAVPVLLPGDGVGPILTVLVAGAAGPHVLRALSCLPEEGATIVLAPPTDSGEAAAAADVKALAAARGHRVVQLPEGVRDVWAAAAEHSPDAAVVPMTGNLEAALTDPRWRADACAGWRGPVVLA
jgi:monovalent cation/proton antiporter MnhG/PhaG subunit